MSGKTFNESVDCSRVIEGFCGADYLKKHDKTGKLLRGRKSCARNTTTSIELPIKNPFKELEKVGLRIPDTTDSIEPIPYYSKMRKPWDNFVKHLETLEKGKASLVVLEIGASPMIPAAR